MVDLTQNWHEISYSNSCGFTASPCINFFFSMIFVSFNITVRKIISRMTFNQHTFTYIHLSGIGELFRILIIVVVMVISIFFVSFFMTLLLSHFINLFTFAHKNFHSHFHSLSLTTTHTRGFCMYFWSLYKITDKFSWFHS